MPADRAWSDGILLVDKEGGMSSHDVVGLVRRALGTREVGHAGTLDPMATGLLVVLVGCATRLSAWAMSEEKSYRTTVRLGATTDTLDADGAIVRTVPGPPPEQERVRAAVAAMVGTVHQVPPAVSALKVDGVRAYERARAGEEVVLAAREVQLYEAKVLAVRDEPPEADVTMRVSKGFYVRSFAAALGEALESAGYLTALRRERSGGYDVKDAVPGAVLRAAAREKSPEALAVVRAAVRPVVEAARGLLTVHEWPAEDEAAGERARALWQGKTVPSELGDEGEVALLAWGARPVCVARRSEGRWRVVRGFAPEPARGT